jgi:hypothetical protein
MTTITINDVTPGSTISFRSKNANDLVSWVGTLLFIGVYQAILPYGNPAAYNAAVRQADPTVPTDVTTLTYFLVKVDNGATTPTLQLFAQEWIAPGSLVQTDLGNAVKILVQDPAVNTQAILSLLASAGYACSVLP